MSVGRAKARRARHEEQVKNHSHDATGLSTTTSAHNTAAPAKMTWRQQTYRSTRASNAFRSAVREISTTRVGMAEPHPIRTNMSSISQSAHATVWGSINSTSNSLNGHTCHPSDFLSEHHGHACHPTPLRNLPPLIGNIDFLALCTPWVTTPWKSPRH
jgi:hypothetical protein